MLENDDKCQNFYLINFENALWLKFSTVIYDYTIENELKISEKNSFIVIEAESHNFIGKI